MNPVRVTIGGQEYNLRSDNEVKLREIATSVDKQLRQLQATTAEPSTTTLSVLTALNIAEQEHDTRHQQIVNTQYLIAEVERMKAFARQTFADEVAPPHDAGRETTRNIG
jgi:cell division protein ZapA (FtsZ GTPase activity inhibitor)